jgi:hypothetical protein
MVKRREYQCLTASIIGLSVIASLSFADITIVRADQKEAFHLNCLDVLAQIRIALSNYYVRQSFSSSANESTLFPPSLHDEGFLENLKNVFKDGKLPVHPCNKDWNDFYNSTDGTLNVTAACDCQQ